MQHRNYRVVRHSFGTNYDDDTSEIVASFDTLAEAKKEKELRLYKDRNKFNIAYHIEILKGNTVR